MPHRLLARNRVRLLARNRVNSQVSPHPTFGLPPLRMRNTSGQIPAGETYACADFRGAAGAGPQALWGVVPRGTLGNSIPPQFYSEPSEANREVSPFLGCQFQQFLCGDSSSRRAKVGFREIRLLPGYKRGTAQSFPVRPGNVSEAGRGHGHERVTLLLRIESQNFSSWESI